MRRVIVNSTPIIALSKIGMLNILRALYQEIYIPMAVYEEVTAKDDLAARTLEASRSWLHVAAVVDDTQRRMYSARLHKGEVEVMLLAKEHDADLVILDDNAAKKTAKYLGFNVTGTLGVILRAKSQGLIDSVEPVILELKRQGFYISKDVERIVLESASTTSE